jgi:HlyD family secretion protein
MEKLGPAPRSIRARITLPNSRWTGRLAIASGVVVTGGVLWLATSQMVRGKGGRREKVEAAVDPAPTVEVIHPQRGGIPRQTIQPGSLLAFESVDLFAMVSGYLKSQVVDIGSHIKKGEVLAEIDAPREAKAVDAAASLLEQSKAQTLQAAARVKAMEAERDAAKAAVEQAKSDINRLVAARDYAQKQLERVRSLLKEQASFEKVVDEHERQFATAMAAEQTARLAVLTATAQVAAVTAKIEQARADVAEAKAAVEVAAAHLATAHVNVAYTRIVAPFNGVVTMRAFNPGAFVRSASEGAESPVLTVKRTDKMRVVVQVPDRDVVSTDPGDPALVKVDAVGGQVFSSAVARVAESEDANTRTMRVEIDLPNPKGQLREGMYGTATITLEPVSTNLTVPPACLVERTSKGRAFIYVVRDGVARRTDVELGTDNGTLVEILSGLKPDDSVIVHSGVPLEDGLAVVASAASTADAGH